MSCCCSLSCGSESEAESLAKIFSLSVRCIDVDDDADGDDGFDVIAAPNDVDFIADDVDPVNGPDFPKTARSASIKMKTIPCFCVSSSSDATCIKYNATRT